VRNVQEMRGQPRWWCVILAPLVFLVVFCTQAQPVDAPSLPEIAAEWAEGDDIRLRITGVSRTTLFRSGLSVSEFQRHLQVTGADYTIEIRDRNMARGLGVFLFDGIKAANPKDAAATVRKKIEFLSANRVELTVYVSDFGHVWWERSVFVRPDVQMWFEALQKMI
jgi:hypothetical protein